MPRVYPNSKVITQVRSSLNGPTLVTLTRLLAVPGLFWLLSLPGDEVRVWAAGLFLVAAATDWLDGYLARRLNQVTELGKFLDPLVDKLLVLAPLLILVGFNEVPAWGVFLILLRELAIAGWRVQQPTVTGANWAGKLKTVVQVVAVTALLLKLPFALALFWAAVILTLWSGWNYLK
ncbi:CDP-diacylglycerol--glycerol-3-phosphate 3-phosphatidyltransferase [Candidatus Cyanaurora vandensis]|uniref:CDP-diacylglycerol--glycerol-3-phosphate 3-phosphatidyltransferase n=1 Tax=Candidatus Cyanaurora vandensis TaxID=2714958 RepID=UPI00257C1756|nr:CDP-diacylglycerol--glycerol-3-phosphate 3-phosphatidyltransferase [Candidatus Cyanaurora vandensis]